MLHRLLGVGEERLVRLAQEILANPRLAEAFASALRKAAETRGKVDRNLQNILHLLNLPSRGDVNRLLTKMETLQGSLVSLNLKIDRLLAESRPRPRRRKASERAAPGD